MAYAECERDVSSQSRGRRFEGLLGFLFGQTGGLRVVEHNFRTATEELDLVLQLDSLDGPRCWCHLGKPFVLVEAKFWKDPVDQQVISTFHTKLEGKRNAALLGLVFGRNGFTADAQTQVIRFSLDEYVMALIGPNELREWIDASNPDDHLEKLVRRAWLA